MEFDERSNRMIGCAIAVHCHVGSKLEEAHLGLAWVWLQIQASAVKEYGPSGIRVGPAEDSWLAEFPSHGASRIL
ncbi:MAG: hypothetical protein RLY70_1724 [Planctomycetota bacterium]|jgi:hypothetical protein